MEYEKIEVLMRDKNGSISKLTFENCFYQFQANFIIISTIYKLNSQLFEVIDLNSVKSYKLYGKQIEE